jgi:hypothetical protein
MSPYFVWSNQLMYFRLSHFVGDAIILYIFIKYHNSDLSNLSLVVFFAIVSLYMMIGGTESSKISYLSLLALFFVTLKPVEQMRVYDLLTSILAVFFAIGIFSYILWLIGLNRPIGTIFAPNLSKNPYLIYFGHIEETRLPVYRFCGIFDEAGVVGTTSGLILAATGISKKNIKSIIILLAGLISFSLAFYVILLIILISSFNIKYIVFTGILGLGVVYFAGDSFNNFIANRLEIKNGQLQGDNRTDESFDEYFQIFLAQGGKDLIFGKGPGSFQKIKEDDWSPSSYKTVVINYGIIGIALMISFYILSTLIINNSYKGWLLTLIFILSAYQRPDLTSYSIIVLYLGGLNYLKISSIIKRKGYD